MEGVCEVGPACGVLADEGGVALCLGGARVSAEQFLEHALEGGVCLFSAGDACEGGAGEGGLESAGASVAVVFGAFEGSLNFESVDVERGAV